MYNEKKLLTLYKYDSGNSTRIAVVDDYEEISWTRNLYEAGEFTVTINRNIPNADFFARDILVQFGDDAYDVGVVTSIVDPIAEDGKQSQILSISGYDLRYLFKRRIIANLNSNGKWEMTAKGEICMRNLIADQCGANAESKRRLPITNTIPQTGIGKTYSVSESYANLYDVLTTIATQSESGWRIKFENLSMVLEFFSGTDRSSTVKFSPSYNSLSNGEFSDSSESFANAVYVGGKGTNDDRDIYEGEDGSPEGFERYEAWDDQSAMTTVSEYTAEASSMLTQYGQTLTVSGTALAKSPYIYKEQYNVGDYITMAFNDKSVSVQILSVTEHWSGRGSYAIEFTFGKPVNTLGDQLQLMLRAISLASDKTSTTDSVRWYTIPTDTAMPKADATYNTIGFVGTCDNNGSTFQLYWDSEGNGAKTYHVYFKQLGGGTLTLTTGQGMTDLTVNSGTYVAIIYVDADGNVTSQGSTPTNTIASGNYQPATSDGVAQAIAGISGGGSYSTTETLTGGTWIDGKPIYRLTINYNNSIPQDSYTTLISNTNIDNLINAHGTISDGVTEFYIPSRWVGLYNHHTYLRVYNYDIPSANKLLLSIEYTKTTD